MVSGCGRKTFSWALALCVWLSVLTEWTPSLEGLILAQGPDAKAELVWFRGPADPQTLLEASEGASVHLVVPVLEPRGPLKTPTQALTSGRPVRAWSLRPQGCRQPLHACSLSPPSFAWGPGGALASTLTLLASGCCSGPRGNALCTVVWVTCSDLGILLP